MIRSLWRWGMSVFAGLRLQLASSSIKRDKDKLRSHLREHRLIKTHKKQMRVFAKQLVVSLSPPQHVRSLPDRTVWRNWPNLYPNHWGPVPDSITITGPKGP